jgi:hypothetical protein
VSGVVGACHALSDRAMVSLTVGAASLVVVLPPALAPGVGERVTALLPAEAIRVWTEVSTGGGVA